MSVLDDYDQIVLRGILRNHAPRLLSGLEFDSASMGESDFELVRSAVCREYSESGLAPDGSPNNKGLILAELIQRLELMRTLQGSGV